MSASNDLKQAIVNMAPAEEELDATIIDLSGFLRGDVSSTNATVELIRKACTSRGVFQVINHGVDAELVRAAEEEGLEAMFKLPMEQKMNIIEGCGYDRCKTKLWWKESFAFNFHGKGSDTEVVDYMKSAYGPDFESVGRTYQKYCEAMNQLGMSLLELLALSLGVERDYYKIFYEDSSCALRYHYHPPCKNPNLTLGNGPHYDPFTLTILHQNQVVGFEVFDDGKWKFVRPIPGAFIVNTGETFVAHSNGMYKSCLHRAVNSEKSRISIPFFLNPRPDKVVKPHQHLISTQYPRKYPDFTWSDYLKYYRSRFTYKGDLYRTIEHFVEWLEAPDDLKHLKH